MPGPPVGGGGQKRRRLSRSAEFERVYRQGRSKANRHLVLYAFPRRDDDGASQLDPDQAAGASRSGAGAESFAPSAISRARPERPQEAQAAPQPRLGLSVSRKVGGAVARTRVKRVLREAFWAEAERLPPEADYVVVARPDAGELAQREGMAGVRAALAELVDALGATDQPQAPSSPGIASP